MIIILTDTGHSYIAPNVINLTTFPLHHVTTFGLLIVPEWSVVRLKTLNVSLSEVVPEKRQKLNRLATTIRSQETESLRA